MHGASAALGNATAKFGAHHAQLVAQDPQQRHFGFDVDLVAFAIDAQFQHAEILGGQR
jgi:hypothetical protein